MNKTLVIENVNFEDLESQRHLINRILFKPRLHEFCKEEEWMALQSISMMLERWSDIRYHEANGHHSMADKLRKRRD